MGLAAALLAGCASPPPGGGWRPLGAPISVRVAMPAAAVAPGDGPLCAEARRVMAAELRAGLVRRGFALAPAGSIGAARLEVTAERCAVVATLWDGPGPGEGAGVTCYLALWVRARLLDADGRLLWTARIRTYEHLEEDDPLPVLATDLTFHEPVVRLLARFRQGGVAWVPGPP